MPVQGINGLWDAPELAPFIPNSRHSDAASACPFDEQPENRDSFRRTGNGNKIGIALGLALVWLLDVILLPVNG
jgi:hypothetical protein